MTNKLFLVVYIFQIPSNLLICYSEIYLDCTQFFLFWWRGFTQTFKAPILGEIHLIWFKPYNHIQFNAQITHSVAKYQNMTIKTWTTLCSFKRLKKCSKYGVQPIRLIWYFTKLKYKWHKFCIITNYLFSFLSIYTLYSILDCWTLFVR